jgi:Xaa-Pro aminopeptidase
MEDGEYMKFKPGMITTIEPGIYISSSMDVEEKWKGIGIRIEDDILVTESGNINLTAKVPSDPSEIEALMA